MIVPMTKVHIVTRSADQRSLLEVLAHLGVVHVEPIDPDSALADEQTLEAISELNTASRILQSTNPVTSEVELNLEPLHIAQETIVLYKTISEDRERLNELYRLADQLSLWGDVKLTELHDLKNRGVHLQFYSIPKDHVGELNAECVETLSALPGNQVLIAVIDRSDQFQAPQEAKPIDWPTRDLPSVKAEAARLDKAIRDNSNRLSELASLLPSIQRHREQLETEAAFSATQRSGMSQSSLFALQGWVPQAKAERLNYQITELGLSAAVNIVPLQEDEEPPTLIEYPKWAKPIKALFDMLGTLPGYKEIDLAPFFMIALPLFAAMLIGDAGYGLILVLSGVIFYSKLIRAVGQTAVHLLIIFGLATLAWGILTGNVFGITPQTFMDTGHENAARAMSAIAPLWRWDAEAGRTLIMQVSIVIGCVHLILAHLRRVIELWPDVRSYAEIGWIVILADMLAIIWYLMFVGAEQMPAFLGLILLVALITVSWFGEPRGGPVKRALSGLAASILPLLGTFSDIMSYIRLFAVGLASYYIAAAFNGLGVQVASSATWIAGAPVVIFGHVLNIALAAIAIFAHGVRLNMLEFSNNVGVKWAGYAYRPFTIHKGTSIGESKS